MKRANRAGWYILTGIGIAIFVLGLMELLNVEQLLNFRFPQQLLWGSALIGIGVTLALLCGIIIGLHKERGEW